MESALQGVAYGEEGEAEPVLAGKPLLESHGGE